MPCAITLRSRLIGNYVHSAVFMGPDPEHLSFTGTLVLEVGQYQIFGAALIAASEQLGDHFVALPDTTEAGVHQALTQQEEVDQALFEQRRRRTPFRQVAPGIEPLTPPAEEPKP